LQAEYETGLNAIRKKLAKKHKRVDELEKVL